MQHDAQNCALEAIADATHNDVSTSSVSDDEESSSSSIEINMAIIESDEEQQKPSKILEEMLKVSCHLII